MASITKSRDAEFGIKDHWRVLGAATLVSLGTFQYGLDFGVIGGLQAMVGFLKVFGEPAPTQSGYNISAVRQQLISSLMILGAFLASGTAGFTALRIGRKLSLWVACVLIFGSTALMQVTTDIGGLYAGRLIIGIANGLLVTHSQLYIHETSPARYRGLAIGAFQYWTSIGNLVGTIIDNFTQQDTSRRAYVLSLGMVHIVPAILVVGLFFIPESPRWLLARGRDADALAALRKLRPYGWRADDEFAEMKVALETETARDGAVGFLDLFRTAVDRRRTLLSIAAVTLQAASGAMFIIAYGTYFLSMANIGAPFEDTCALIAAGVAAVIINGCVITRYGYRRIFLISGLLFCGICMLIMAAVSTAQPGTLSTNSLVVAMSILYIVSYNGAISTYAWVSGGELPSQRLRSYTFGLATAVGFFGAWLTTFTAPYFINPAALGWGPKYGYIWAPSCFLTALWVYLYFPETKNRTLEEIDEMFEAGLPARKFRGYKCTRIASMAAIVHAKERTDAEELEHVSTENKDSGVSTTVA